MGFQELGDWEYEGDGMGGREGKGVGFCGVEMGAAGIN